MIYFIADHHFNDENIIKYENRPYANKQEMHDDMIRKWNSVVTEDDEVYVLGDFYIPTSEKHYKDAILPAISVLRQLNGTKYLVAGNHDIPLFTDSDLRKMGFERVYDKPIILDGFWMLSHEPLYVNDSIPYVNIFGHIHNSPLYINYSKRHYCVCVERVGYIPVSFDEIKRSIIEEGGNINERV